MAHTLRGHNKGGADISAPTISGTESQYVTGPPVMGAAKSQSRWTWESGSGTSRVYRWLGDEAISSASPTGYIHALV